jgi:aspartokinase-like uncharacterized kinase
MIKKYANQKDEYIISIKVLTDSILLTVNKELNSDFILTKDTKGIELCVDQIKQLLINNIKG